MSSATLSQAPESVVWPLVAFAAFAWSLAISWLLTPASAKLGERLGLIDSPTKGPDAARKSHAEETPRSGGIAVAAAFFGVALGGALLGPIAQEWLRRDGALSPIAYAANAKLVYLPMAGILGGAFAMFALGLADDRLNLSATPKLFAQIAAGALLYACDVRATAFLPEPLGVALTILWTVAICNAFNFLDNMNGLASGVGALSALAFAGVSWLSGEWLLMCVWCALAGSCLGFWRWNFFQGRPFLGDGGSLLVGFLMAALSLRATYYEPGAATTALPVLTPPILLALPLFDAASVIWIRHREKRPLMKGDRCHLSHRLEGIGFPQRGAVMAHYLIVMVCALVAWALRYAPMGPAIGLVAAVGLLFLFLYLLERAAARHIKGLKE
jgi:UDP-GlcNAc:undecaprenyl-phosphate GlcNAc-1-phosphate transferase